MDIYKKEVWKELNFGEEKFRKKYAISNMGRIKSYTEEPRKEKIMRGAQIGGYKSVSLMAESGKMITRYIHKLVAEYFLERESDDRQYVIHIDYDKTNNFVHNLKWVDQAELTEHQNRNPKVKKARVTGYKLDENKVRIIKQLLSSNKTRLSMIAKRFGITHTQLNRIRSGENWGHVKVE